MGDQERGPVEHNNELAELRDEVEALAGFLRMLQREYIQLHSDFTATLHTAGGAITVAEADRMPPNRYAIERTEAIDTGTAIFRLLPRSG
jgi:hypothetical protein